MCESDFRSIERDGAEVSMSGDDVDSPCIMVVFGASGDLTRKKLIPALYSLDCDGLLDDNFTIVGFARSDKSREEFRNEIRDTIQKFSRKGLFSPEVWERFSSRLHYFTGQYDDPTSHIKFGKFLGQLETVCGARRYLYYLALPPTATEALLKCMNDARCLPGGPGEARPRIMIEKPFGLDYASAKRLNLLLSSLFGESQVYRIDHYIAKDTIRNLLVLRFANAIFEPIWNRQYIDNIQITAAEDIGIEGRGAYYDEAGVVRDMVQNHVLQVLALVAMESPLAGDAESTRDKKSEVFKSLAPILSNDFVFGQYRGYREEPKVDAHSVTPTFVAARFLINNWRWQGVPFYIRSGKRLPQKLTEAIIQFKRVPLCVLDEELCRVPIEPNALVIRIQPDEGIRLLFTTMVPGREDEISQASMDFRYATSGMQPSEAYERVLLDAVKGRPTLFWRADSVEAAWRAVAPLLKPLHKEVAENFPNYEPGSWGPKEAEDLLGRDGRRWFRDSSHPTL